MTVAIDLIIVKLCIFCGMIGILPFFLNKVSIYLSMFMYGATRKKLIKSVFLKKWYNEGIKYIEQRYDFRTILFPFEEGTFITFKS